jgi:osomolarity two-component system sensor histidine kinase NIK1
LDILLVEDNLLNQKVVTFHLKKYKHNVVSVENGFDAIEQVKQRQFDLVLMDLMLPEMDGHEITHEIRKIEKEKGVENEMPIIAITANTLDNDREKCYAAGMNEYLAKPFTAEQLMDKIEALLSK